MAKDPGELRDAQWARRRAEGRSASRTVGGREPSAGFHPRCPKCGEPSSLERMRKYPDTAACKRCGHKVPIANLMGKAHRPDPIAERAAKVAAEVARDRRKAEEKGERKARIVEPSVRVEPSLERIDVAVRKLAGARSSSAEKEAEAHQRAIAARAEREAKAAEKGERISTRAQGVRRPKDVVAAEKAEKAKRKADKEESERLAREEEARKVRELRQKASEDVKAAEERVKRARERTGALLKKIEDDRKAKDKARGR